MSRYIDKDEAIRRFGELHGEGNALLNCYNADWIESFLECQPEADVVEVVRCKDCKYYEPYPNLYGEHRTDGDCACLSETHDAARPMTQQSHYCSYGEMEK